MVFCLVRSVRRSTNTPHSCTNAWQRPAKVIIRPPLLRQLESWFWVSPWFHYRYGQHGPSNTRGGGAQFAGFVFVACRADVARAGATVRAEVTRELCQTSPAFEALWKNNDVLLRRRREAHPSSGWRDSRYGISPLTVEGRSELGTSYANEGCLDLPTQGRSTSIQHPTFTWTS